MTSRSYGVLFFALFAVGCGKEAGRVAFASEGTSSSTVALQAGDVSFWTDIDVKYEGQASAIYKVELVQDGAIAARAECDPFGPINVKVGWVSTNIGSSHSMSGSGKMQCSATVPKAGPTGVRVRLEFSEKPASLVLKKADLVLKQ